ncbi:hypothetical protein H0H81_001397 [Sphagnurus paluster]|uniref:Uncharacterized protein n=1 Tax=Sphagnurus paluster TaxID=117069 RepID=A0A9P7KJR7_9AGAR|nr:hypothetical protein H0H81_001397 [Sphagnurus paluster]
MPRSPRHVLAAILQPAAGRREEALEGNGMRHGHVRSFCDMILDMVGALKRVIFGA